jgi:hypothetical protein
MEQINNINIPTNPNITCGSIANKNKNVDKKIEGRGSASKTLNLVKKIGDYRTAVFNSLTIIHLYLTR